MEYSIEDKLMESVTTYDGTTAPRKDCRFIKGDYYLKNAQCFFIDGKWYRINSGYIVFDHEVKSWILRSTAYSLKTGIVYISPDCTNIERGAFTANLDKNVLIRMSNGDFETAIDYKMLDANPMIEESVSGIYYFKKDESKLSSRFTTKLKPNKDGFYTFPFNYGSDELLDTFSTSFREKFVGKLLSSDAYKYLEDYTFGVEFETERGAIPERFLMPNGLIACRDGSIAGFEYTTIPLNGESGIMAIKKNCELLSKYCSCSPNESLHIHIGNYPKTLKNIAALYRLALLLQEEIYTMFPYFYIDTAQFKRKSYCGPLPRYELESTDALEIFSGLYYFLSNGNTFGSRFPTGAHPMDRSGQHKWDISPRYLWMNVIPLIWGKRGTVEFRCHTPTLDSQKVINWLFIVVSILKYAKKHTKDLVSSPYTELPPITLMNVICEAYPKKISSVLLDYISTRKKHYADKCDVVGESEIYAEQNKDSSLFNLTPFI